MVQMQLIFGAHFSKCVRFISLKKKDVKHEVTNKIETCVRNGAQRKLNKLYTCLSLTATH